MKELLTWFIENWAVVLGLVCLLAVVVVAIIKFLKLPSATQVAKIKECLLAWVIEAERDLGGGTGEIKLRTVYGWFVTAFPIVKNFVSFETFSVWVDEALDIMREMLEKNKNLKHMVEEEAILATRIVAVDNLDTLK